MHLVAGLRGMDDKMFRLIQDCQAVYFPYKRMLPYNFEELKFAEDFIEKNIPEENRKHYEIVECADKKFRIKVQSKVQMGVRPWQIYEFVFPKEHLPWVLKFLHPTGSWNSKLNKFITVIRKVMGLKAVPKFEGELREATFQRSENQVEMSGIGIKEDKEIDGIEQL